MHLLTQVLYVGLHIQRHEFYAVCGSIIFNVMIFYKNSLFVFKCMLLLIWDLDIELHKKNK